MEVVGGVGLLAAAAAPSRRRREVDNGLTKSRESVLGLDSSPSQHGNDDAVVVVSCTVGRVPSTAEKHAWTTFADGYGWLRA